MTTRDELRRDAPRSVPGCSGDIATTGRRRRYSRNWRSRRRTDLRRLVRSGPSIPDCIVATLAALSDCWGGIAGRQVDSVAGHERLALPSLAEAIGGCRWADCGVSGVLQSYTRRKIGRAFGRDIGEQTWLRTEASKAPDAIRTNRPTSRGRTPRTRTPRTASRTAAAAAIGRIAAAATKLALPTAPFDARRDVAPAQSPGARSRPRRKMT